ncbi:phosphotransferase [Streptosporangiaceae bacterium NEAU-GS5]|nr:phosphotransferase [Streptosporangiaceae bacterium NEAU-GS5]
MRLPHGYTNETGRSDGLIHKAYLGPDPELRYRTERAALIGLSGRLPVPEVRGGHDGRLLVQEIAGWHGQEALDAGHAGPVLRLCGELRRRLSEVDPAQVPGLSGAGQVIVHGDFGPQNLLVNAAADEVVAVFDWEWCHLGSAVEDLAWAEWIVRMHHRAAVPFLGELFTGYGSRPPWSERHAAMLRACENCRDFCVRWESPAAVAMWDQRIQQTREFRDAG